MTHSRVCTAKTHDGRPAADAAGNVAAAVRSAQRVLRASTVGAVYAALRHRGLPHLTYYTAHTPRWQLCCSAAPPVHAAGLGSTHSLRAVLLAMLRGAAARTGCAAQYVLLRGDLSGSRVLDSHAASTPAPTVLVFEIGPFFIAAVCCPVLQTVRIAACTDDMFTGVESPHRDVLDYIEAYAHRQHPHTAAWLDTAISPARAVVTVCPAFHSFMHTVVCLLAVGTPCCHADSAVAVAPTDAHTLGGLQMLLAALYVFYVDGAVPVSELLLDETNFLDEMHRYIPVAEMCRAREYDCQAR